MTTTETETDPRAALAERVRGVERTCAYCGTRRPCKAVKVTADRLRGSGEHVWGVCDDCGPSVRVGNLAAVVVRDLLGLDPDDDALEHVGPVEFFHDRDAADPARPNATPWAHMNADDLAADVARWRRDEERRSGGPCAFCGMGTTPPGTAWNGNTCGGCRSEFGGLPVPNSGGNRDHAASVLIGLRHGGTTIRPLNLGAELGLVWWSESGQKRANRTPFGHLDIAAMRAVADELQRRTNYFSRPAWWSPDSVGTVEWGRE